MKIIRVLLDFFSLTFAELLTRANAVYEGLNNNPAYPAEGVLIFVLGGPFANIDRSSTNRGLSLRGLRLDLLQNATLCCILQHFPKRPPYFSTV